MRKDRILQNTFLAQLTACILSSLAGTIGSMVDGVIIGMSRAVWDFCEAHGCDERRIYLLSLSVEEMAGNIITHGFSKDKKQHMIDVRVISKGEHFIIRIRDDCPIFDPIHQLELFSEDDLTHHLGLRMTANISDELQYTSILRLNNLLIKI